MPVRSRADLIERPGFHRVLAGFAASCLVGTLATDLAYWLSADTIWADFSDWLVTAGVIVGWATVVIAVIETLAFRARRIRRPGWPSAIGFVVALIIATVDMLVHTRDAWTSVVPEGLGLSAAMVLVLALAGWMARTRRPAADVEMTA